MAQKLYCEVTDVVNHGERVYSVFLKPDSLVPRFLPGQFLHLALDSYNFGDFWPESRVFSIASTVTERDLLRITYAVKGKFTSRMESELHRGSRVWIKMPYGEFTVSPKNDACLLAGGTGITAFTAFVAGLTADYHHRVYLFYGARRPDLLIYRQLIEEAAKNCSCLHTAFFAERVIAGANCLSGRIDLDSVWKLVHDPLSVTYYVAGPPEMIQVFLKGISQRGVMADHIVTDAWE